MNQPSFQKSNCLNTVSDRFLLKRILIGSLSILGSLTSSQIAAATGSFVIAEPLAPPPQVSAPVTLPQMAPTPTPPKPVQLSAPKVSVPAPQTPPITQAQPVAQVPTTGKNSYIDTTNYRGTTAATPQPPAVVLNERVTGCQTLVQNGQLSSGSCGQAKREAIAHPLPAPPQPVTSQPAFNPRSSPAQVSPRPAQVTAAPVSPPYNRATVQPSSSQVNNTALLFPLSIPATISSAFGWRDHPIVGTRRMHTGTDLAAPMGTPVLAAYEGEVAVADSLGGYGLTVILRHEQGTQESRYGHLSEIFVQVGEWIEQGTVIGSVGSTGMSTGPHLHFEWRHLTHSGWVAVDAGVHLEYALDNMLDALEVAQGE